MIKRLYYSLLLRVATLAILLYNHIVILVSILLVILLSISPPKGLRTLHRSLHAARLCKRIDRAVVPSQGEPNAPQLGNVP